MLREFGRIVCEKVCICLRSIYGMNVCANEV